MKVIKNVGDGLLYLGFITFLVTIVVVGATALSAVLG